jgi:hypothetical protein
MRARHHYDKKAAAVQYTAAQFPDILAARPYQVPFGNN